MQYYNNIDSLYHHGILGMRWGVRRYQNKDGSLTAAGKKRYLKEMYKGKVTNRDDAQIKKAAKNTRDYAVEKYGKSAVQALARSGVLGRAIQDFDIVGSTNANRAIIGEDAVKKNT